MDTSGDADTPDNTNNTDNLIPVDVVAGEHDEGNNFVDRTVTIDDLLAFPMGTTLDDSSHYGDLAATVVAPVQTPQLWRSMATLRSKTSARSQRPMSEL